jgi:hypothetical protein
MSLPMAAIRTLLAGQIAYGSHLMMVMAPGA